MVSENCKKKFNLLKFLSKFELQLWFNCNQMDIKMVVFIKCGRNTAACIKIRHLRHFVQNLLGVKVHTSCKISKFCQHFGATKTHVGKFFGT